MFNEFSTSSQIVHQIGWTIVHSLWQGALIALILFLVLRILKNSASNIRYAVSCLALALALLCPVATAILINQNPTAATSVGNSFFLPDPNFKQEKISKAEIAESKDEQVSFSANALAAQPLNLAARTEKFFPWLILIWTLGVLIFSLRLGAGFLHIRRLINSAENLPAPYVESVMSDLTRRLGIKRTVRVFESALIKIPTTAGWIYPVILIPPSALLGLTPQQLQSIIAHELAHIKRFDFLVNLLQIIVETLLFYHPATHWISNKIRQEREFACDDLTLKLCGDAVVYARALTKVARFGNEASQAAALAANGGELSRRIHRLIKIAPHGVTSRSSYFQSASIIIFLSLIVTAGFAVAFYPDKNNQFENVRSSNLNETRQPIQKSEENNNLSETDRLNIYGDDLEKENLAYRRIAVEALEGHLGSVVIMHPQTGQIYTIVNQEWAFRRGWSPASTFKMVTAIAALEENLLKTSEKGFGYDSATRLDLTRAIAVSNNDYFKSLGREVGAESLIKYAKQFGLGSSTGINYDGEIRGFVPDSNSGKDELLGFCGGSIEVTPLQLAVLTSAIANGGKILVPQAVQADQPVVPNERGRFSFSANTLSELKKGLRETVKSGTGNAAHNSDGEIAGKTGTTASKKSGSGLFVSYAPADNSSLVVVVALDGKNESGANAAKIAGRIYARLNEN